MEAMHALSYLVGRNAYRLDPDLRAVLDAFWPAHGAHAAELDAFARWVGAEALPVAYHVDHEARPVLVAHDLDGRRIDRVRFSPAQEALLPRLAAMNRPPYQEGGSWHHHFALGGLLADPGLYCLATITNQTIYVIRKYLPDRDVWAEHLLAGRWWGATWLTEAQGGSDLGATALRAEPDGDAWRLWGEKYFCSGAGHADLAVVVARPPGAPPGPKGLGLFLVPRCAPDGRLNFFVRRLKDKSATRAVPSGEVEFVGSWAVLVPPAERGLYRTLEMLALARLANAVGAMGLARKAELEVRWRVRRRRAFGRLLRDHPLVRWDLLELAVRMAGGWALAFLAVDAFERIWRQPDPDGPEAARARALLHAAKNRTADHAAEVTRLAMELFGGLGFLEEYAVARWHREALITPIWEGPANIQALDLREAVRRKGAADPLRAALAPHLAQGTAAARRARAALDEALATLAAEDAEAYAKAATARLADAAQVAALYAVAATGGERYARLAELYAARFLDGADYPQAALADPALIDLPLEDEEAPPPAAPTP